MREKCFVLESNTLTLMDPQGSFGAKDSKSCMQCGIIFCCLPEKGHCHLKTFKRCMVEHQYPDPGWLRTLNENGHNLLNRQILGKNTTYYVHIVSHTTVLFVACPYRNGVFVLINCHAVHI